MHLLVTAVLKEPLTFNQIFHFLTDIVTLLQLELVSGPHIHFRENNWIALAIIAESHISIHTQDHGIFVDIFSCKEFDVEKILPFIVDTLDLAFSAYQVIERKIPTSVSFYLK